MSGIERLELFLRTHSSQYIRTSEIIKWGCNDGYSNRAARNARVLANKGVIQRISRTEATLLGFNTKEGIYKIF